MARDILSEYGKDSHAPMSPRATNGGHMPVKEIPYSPPQGPLNMSHKGPGLGGGTNHGTGQRHDPGHETSSKGIGSTSHGNRGTQR